MRSSLVVALVLLAGTAASAVAAPETAPVTRGSLRVEVEATGRLLPAEPREARLDLREFPGPLVVMEAAAPGSRVAHGEVVLRFDDRDLREAIDDARFELELLRREARAREIALHVQAEREREGLERQEQDLAAAGERLAAWLEVEKPVAIERDRLEAASDAHRLKEAEDELAQLVEMYEEDELVDETEAIVMARARFTVETRRARNALNAKLRAFRAETERPRRERDLRRDVDRRRFDLEHAKRDAEVAADGRDRDFARFRRILDERRRRLEGLREDLHSLSVPAPADGMLLHGAFEGGFGRRFSPGQRLDAASPVVTVLPAEPLVARVAVPAKEILRLRPGEDALVTPAATGADAVPGHVVAVAPATSNDEFEVTIAARGDLPAALLGTKVAARILVAVVEDALLVPTKAVRRESGKTFVLVAGEDGPRRRDVVVGAASGGRTVIEEGLSKRERVLLTGDGE